MGTGVKNCDLRGLIQWVEHSDTWSRARWSWFFGLLFLLSVSWHSHMGMGGLGSPGFLTAVIAQYLTRIITKKE